MDAITALHTRNSSPLLVEPAPQGRDREQIFQAALRAPDHARLRPWRFLCVEGEARQRLGELLCEAALVDDLQLDSAKQTKLKNAPLRAPLIIVVAARISEHPKVPEVEQILSAGAALTNMLNAAHALGFACIWRTGAISYSRTLMGRLGLQANEKIVGFLYLGSAGGELKALPEFDSGDFFEQWEG